MIALGKRGVVDDDGLMGNQGHECFVRHRFGIRVPDRMNEESDEGEKKACGTSEKTRMAPTGTFCRSIEEKELLGKVPKKRRRCGFNICIALQPLMTMG